MLRARVPGTAGPASILHFSDIIGKFLLYKMLRNLRLKCKE